MAYYTLKIDDLVDYYLNILLFPLIKEDVKIIKNSTDEIRYIIVSDLQNHQFENGDISIRDYSLYCDLRTMNSKLGHLTGCWAIDWAWIIHHIRLDYINVNKGLSLREKKDFKGNLIFKNDDEIFIYKDCYNHNIYSKTLYLKNTITYEPQIFRLSQILSSDCQLSYNLKSFQPIVGATNYGLINGDSLFWDDFNIVEYENDTIWNPNKRRFDYIESPSKIKRKSKVKIYINGKKFEV